MQQNIEDDIIRLIDPFHDYLWKWIPSNGRSGGILVGIRLELAEVGSFTEGEFMLQLNLWDKKMKIKWNLITVYGATQDDRKEAFLDELALFYSKSKEPFIVGGDFNIIRFPHEKNKPGSRSRHTDNFNAVISAFEHREITMTGGKFTWTNNQIDPTLERLDRALMSRVWEDAFPCVVINKLPREISDHNPLLLTTDVTQPSKHLTFIFELAWLAQQEFYAIISGILNKACFAETTFDRIQIKLKRCKQYLKGWGFSLQGERKKRKAEIQESLKKIEMEEYSPLSLDKINERVELVSELLKILEEDELYWFKRSHETWLHKGDNNAEFFHRVVNGRKRKSTIFSLQDGENTIEGDNALLKHANNYYRSLFGPPDNIRIPPSPELFGEASKLSDRENNELCKPFSEEEIKYALFQMEYNKAAGPDRIPIEFYQHCWEIIKEDVVEMFDDFHKGKLDASRLNYGIITLLPKTNDANKINSSGLSVF